MDASRSKREHEAECQPRGHDREGHEAGYPDAVDDPRRPFGRDRRIEIGEDENEQHQEDCYFGQIRAYGFSKR